jgi:PHD/YefM family antitoxin component YafN of YafNO toxin-antitoxin module
MMPHIIPIRDLKNTSKISELCNSSKEPIFVTKNGYGEMVLMSMETYEKTMFLNDVYRKLDEAEQSVQNGEVKDGFESLKGIRKKYGL